MQPTKITKTEPNKSPNQHHHPTNQHHHPTSGCHKSEKKNTNHRPIGNLGTGQMGKRANHNTNQSTHSINTIGSTTEIAKNHSKHKSIKWIGETQGIGDSPIGGKTEQKSEGKGEIGMGK